MFKIQNKIYSLNGEIMKMFKIFKTIKNFSKNFIKMNFKNKALQLK